MTTTPAQLVAELSARLDHTDPRDVVLAFDGDGTLWSGDVGEDLFYAALRSSFLLETARPALLAEAERHRVDLNGAHQDPNSIARTLMNEYLAGRYPERDTCAMMTWCYAGRPLAELHALAASVLKQENLQGRLTRELGPILEWARQRKLRCVLISASPRAIVEPAGKHWAFDPWDIAAATPAVVADEIAPLLAAPVPYAEAKLLAGKALFGKARWLASFGDNVFDIEMLQAAELGIAVRPKPKLVAELPRLGLRVLTSAADPSAAR